MRADFESNDHSLTYFRGRLPLLGAHDLPGRLFFLSRGTR